MKDILFFGYYTANTPYEQEFAGLEFYFKNLNMRYEYKAIEHRGSWQKNTQAKAEVVEDFLIRHPGERLCYVDVDSVILTRPELLWTVTSDVAAVLFGGQELLSGVVLFESNVRTLALVRLWKQLNTLYPEYLPDGREAWDQRTLWMAIQKFSKAHGNFFSELPPAYNFIADLSAARYPGVHPVILATRGSSRFKKQIDTGVI